MSKHIKITTQDRVTTVRIARPEKKNAITQDMYAAMAAAILDYSDKDDARALIITGEGDMFTAGNDLHDFPTEDQEGEPTSVQFLNALRDCPKVVIAAVNGPAIGIGLTLLLHCDLVYARDTATFSAPFVKLGLVPEAGSSMLLPRAVGPAVANDVFLAGRTLSAEEAHQYGLAARVISSDTFDASVGDIASRIAATAPSALRHSKSLIRHQRQTLSEQMLAEDDIFAEQLSSPDFTESIAAMMEKRPPVYS